MLRKPLGVPYIDKKIQNKFRFGSWVLSGKNTWHLYNETIYRMGIQLVNDRPYQRFCYILYRKHTAFHDRLHFSEDVVWHSYGEVTKSGLTICPKCAKIWKERYGKAYKENQAEKSKTFSAYQERLRKEKAKEPSWRDC